MGFGSQHQRLAEANLLYFFRPHVMTRNALDSIFGPNELMYLHLAIVPTGTSPPNARRLALPIAVKDNRVACETKSSHNPSESGIALMKLIIVTEQEEDGRWIAEIEQLPGVMQYGRSREEAIARVEALALRVVADRIEQGERPVEPIQITFAAA